MSGFRAVTLAFALALIGSAAHAFGVADLQRLLRAAPAPGAAGIAFHELRESPWLAAPVESRGSLHSTPALLEKRLVSPRREVWRIRADRIEWSDPGAADAAAPRQILFSDAPGVATLAGALRRIVGAELLALEADFRIETGGDERVWTARLVPRDAGVARKLEAIELQGTGARLRVIVVVERQGERTTTRLDP